MKQLFHLKENRAQTVFTEIFFSISIQLKFKKAPLGPLMEFPAPTTISN